MPVHRNHVLAAISFITILLATAGLILWEFGK